MSTSESEQSDNAAEAQTPHQYLLLASIQLRDTFIVEINAKRYPVDIPTERAAATTIGLEEIQLADDDTHAQAILSIQIGYHEEPKPFEISFKIVGVFAYLPNTPKEAVLQFLNQGSLGVLLPFARELLMNLCTRLQIPIIIIPMIQLFPSPHQEISPEETQEPSSHQ